MIRIRIHFYHHKHDTHDILKICIIKLRMYYNSMLKIDNKNEIIELTLKKFLELGLL